MKKAIRIFAIVLCVTMLSACGAGKPEDKQVSSVEVQNQAENSDPTKAQIEKFVNECVNTTERPIAVMVDNDDKNARPHAGLNDAYLIYEMVVEGGATRFMALFRGVDTEKIGPVRSSRHYFLDYVMENDAIYTHFGWSPRAISDIAAFGINKINGVLGTDGGIFWRERKYKGDWHSAYTGIAKIKDMAAQKHYALDTDHKNGLKYSEAYVEISDGKPAQNVKLKYSGSYNTGYTYDAESGMYKKNINGAPHALQDGSILEVKNIIIVFVNDTDLGDGTARRNINTVGSGKGLYITGGACEEITWSKASRGGNTTYKKADGTELKVSPGKTIINLISPSSEVVFD